MVQLIGLKLWLSRIQLKIFFRILSEAKQWWQPSNVATFYYTGKSKYYINCCYLLLLTSITNFSCWLLLLTSITNFCYWLLLLTSITNFCYWLLLLTSIANFLLLTSVTNLCTSFCAENLLLISAAMTTILMFEWQQQHRQRHGHAKIMVCGILTHIADHPHSYNIETKSLTFQALVWIHTDDALQFLRFPIYFFYSPLCNDEFPLQ